MGSGFDLEKYLRTSVRSRQPIALVEALGQDALARAVAPCPPATSAA